MASSSVVFIDIGDGDFLDIGVGDFLDIGPIGVVLISLTSTVQDKVEVTSEVSDLISLNSEFT